MYGFSAHAHERLVWFAEAYAGEVASAVGASKDAGVEGSRTGLAFVAFAG